ncbi:hypothetical protein BC829DRAFT_30922 [Chytridium lagenaria]|nr:hypothetical protein BC829DRAFT_30922 [Chytridium lagenaria]
MCCFSGMSFRMASFLRLNTPDLLRFPSEKRDITAEDMSVRDRCWRICVLNDNLLSNASIEPSPTRFFNHSAPNMHRIMNLSYFTFIPANDISAQALIHYITTLSYVLYDLRQISLLIDTQLRGKDRDGSRLGDLIISSQESLQQWTATLPPNLTLEDTPATSTYHITLLTGYYGATCMSATSLSRIVTALDVWPCHRDSLKSLMSRSYMAPK